MRRISPYARMQTNTGKADRMAMTEPVITYRRFESILKWAKFCQKSENYDWTIWDSNLCMAIKCEQARQKQVMYLDYRGRHLPREALIIDLRPLKNKVEEYAKKYEQPRDRHGRFAKKN